jgi:hypothetical protein
MKHFSLFGHSSVEQMRGCSLEHRNVEGIGMRENENDTDVLRRYLLGEVAGEQEDRIEQRLLADDAFFELAEAVEGDLLDACARGELTSEERQRALKRLASSRAGHARLMLVEGLIAQADGLSDTQPLQVPPAPLRFRRRFASLSQPWVRAAVAAGFVGFVVLARGPLLNQAANKVLERQLGNQDQSAVENHKAKLALARRPAPLGDPTRGTGTSALAIVEIELGQPLHIQLDPMVVVYSSYSAIVRDMRTKQELPFKNLPFDTNTDGTIVHLRPVGLPLGKFEVRLFGHDKHEPDLLGTKIFRIWAPLAP